MSRLYWPQSTDPRTSDEDAPLPFNILLPMNPVPGPQRPYFAYISDNVAETGDGELEVVRATLQTELDCRDAPTSHSSGSSTECDVVCKVAHSKLRLNELKEEARLYEGALAPLQGTVVPKYYGCFIGNSPDGVVGVLVTEDCGDPLSRELKSYSKRFRQTALEALMDRAGVAHGNFTRRNIVSWDDDLEWLRLVNFQSAREHDCPCVAKSIDTTKTLSWGDIRCHELYYACVKAQLCF
ncbi:hypothetical protein OH76DRAFT_1393416 [Lentinus brumalis]|uniref:Aminoglycoside phosphotransferase domain-containing protein n=1 Tax=Lentinus brumalis TaxID=2498619 RepID=A0A371CLV4_9APHY|nr:hypothetical protein OH76DRAFT_1393416 [Polyporus brumalis]